MTMTVRGLLDRPRLQLTLVGGAAGLDREITWAHASDLPAPWDYLGPERAAADERDRDRVSARRPGALRRAAGQDRGERPGRRARHRRCSGYARARRAGRRARAAAAHRALLDQVQRHRPRRRRGQRRARDPSSSATSPSSTTCSGCRSPPATSGPRPLTSLGRRLGLRLHLVDAETGASVFDDQAVVPLGQVLARSVAEHGHAIPGLLRLSRDGSADGDVCALAVAVPGDPLTALIVEPLGDRLPGRRRAAARRDRRRGPARPDRLAAAAGAASGRRAARPASGSAPGLAGAEQPSPAPAGLISPAAFCSCCGSPGRGPRTRCTVPARERTFPACCCAAMTCCTRSSPRERLSR